MIVPGFVVKGKNGSASKLIMAEDYSREPYLWTLLYQRALAENDPEYRQQLLLQAKTAVLNRARHLEEQGGTDDECAALEEAATRLGKIKATQQSDGHATRYPEES